MDKNSQIHIGTPEDLALQGVLSRFFHKKGIYFDEQAGLFRIQNQPNTQIKLVGEGIRYLMMQKALLRNGIQADAQQQSANSIVVSDTAFEWHTADGNCELLQSIEEVLTRI